MTGNGAHPHCMYCEEAILPTDQRAPVRGAPMHWECSVRIIAGSVAHIEGRCGCKVPNSEEGDPPGMTRREAAKAAVVALRRKQEKE